MVRHPALPERDRRILGVVVSAYIEQGEPVSSLRELYAALWRKGPGEAMGLQVLRDSAIRLVDVVAGDRDEFYK